MDIQPVTIHCICLHDVETSQSFQTDGVLVVTGSSQLWQSTECVWEVHSKVWEHNLKMHDLRMEYWFVELSTEILLFHLLATQP